MTLRQWIARTDFFPFRPLYAGLYWAGVHYLKRNLAGIPGLEAVYLSGSYALGRHVHGESDVDFFVLLEARRRDQLPGLTRALHRAVTLFPFLGPLSERHNQVVLVDDDGEVDNADLLYRHRRGLLRPLWERPGFVLRGWVPECVQTLHYLALQLKLAELRPDTLAKRREALGDPGSGSLEESAERQARAAVAGLPRLRLRVENAAPSRSGAFLRQPGSGHGFSWQPLSLLGFADPLLVLSRWQAPWLFGEDEIPAPVWDWTRREAERTLRSLAEQLEQAEKSLLESDLGLLQALMAAWILLQIGPEGLRLYSDARSLWADLERSYPGHAEFLGLAGEFYQALQDGVGPAFCERLPGNFFGHLIQFTLALLRQAPLPSPADLHRRLRVSLCVVTRDRPSWLKALLETVARQTRAPDQVVIVDNSPTASAAPICDEFSQRLAMHYVRHPEGQLGAVRNRALQEADGEVLCFTDDDCLLEPGWLGHAERSFLRDERIGAVGGRVRHLVSSDSAVDHFHRIYLG